MRFYLSVFALLICLLPIFAEYSKIVAGVLDLSCNGCYNGEYVAIKGDADLYWQKFVNSKILAENPEIKPDAKIRLPGVWNDIVIDGKKIGGVGYGTVHFKAIFPHDFSKPSLKVKTIQTAYQIYIDSVLIAAVGVPYETAAETYAAVMPQVMPIPVLWNQKEVDVYIQISNFIDNKGGPWQIMHLGNYDSLSKLNIFAISYQMIMLGILFCFILKRLFFLHEKNGDIYPKKRIIALIVLNCFIALRILITDEKFLYFFFPDVDMQIFVALEHLTFYGIFVTIQMLFNYTLPNNVNKIFTKAITILGVISAIFVFVSPLLLYSKFIPYWYLIAVLAILNITIQSIINIKKTDKMSILILFGTLVLTLTCVHDIIMDALSFSLVFMELNPLGLIFYSTMQDFAIHKANIYRDTLDYLRKNDYEANRNILFKRINDTMITMRRNDDSFCVIVIDMKNLQESDILYGLSFADKFQNQFEFALFKMNIGDFIENYDYGKFAIVIENMKKNTAKIIVENLNDYFNNIFLKKVFGSDKSKISLNFGIAEHYGKILPAEELLKKAENSISNKIQ